jgi:hypothetical protein
MAAALAPSCGLCVCPLNNRELQMANRKIDTNLKAVDFSQIKTI